MSPVLSCYKNQTKKLQEKENYRPILQMKMNKNFKKNITKLDSARCEGLYTIRKYDLS